MHTIELIIQIPESQHELIVAELDDMGGLGYVQENQVLKAYFDVNQWTPRKREVLADRLNVLNSNATWSESMIPEQDWNEPWEKSVKPVHAGPFLVRPSWFDGDKQDEIEEIIIDPKMSFGTGHHETTRLIMEKLPSYVRENDVVLDAGAGTAILAIAAIKLGASFALAFDIDHWALENGKENISLNKVSDQIELRNGSFNVVPEREFDLVLANINRNVLIQYADDLALKLSAQGHLLLSGVLLRDRGIMEDTFVRRNLILIDEAQEGEWWLGILRKRNNSDALSS